MFVNVARVIAGCISEVVMVNIDEYCYVLVQCEVVNSA